MSKTLEKLAVHRHVMLTVNFSVYRSRHSTETALLKVVNDVVMSACDRHATVLADRTNGRAYATVLRLSVVICDCDVMYCG